MIFFTFSLLGFCSSSSIFNGYSIEYRSSCSIFNGYSSRLVCNSASRTVETKDLTQQNLQEFVTPNLRNEVETIIQKRRKNVQSTAVYHQALLSQKNFTVPGFSIYYVHTFVRTKILKVSQKVSSKKHTKIKYCKKRKIKQKQTLNKVLLQKIGLKRCQQSSGTFTSNYTCTPGNNSSLYLYTAPTGNLTTVLSSDQFVFKPDILINETNYPLHNEKKQELDLFTITADRILCYSFNDSEMANYTNFPSVSKIIEQTVSDRTRQALLKWRQKMISNLGEDGFQNHSKALKTRGTEFHIAVRNAILGKATENCSEVTEKSLKSLGWMLKHISSPVAIESSVAHPKLGYKGIIDCIAMFRGIPVVIDWKLSDKPKKDIRDTYDAPVQVTAYIGALNHDPNYQWGVNHGLIVVVYPNGDPCDVFVLTPKYCKIYWRHWLKRFDKFKTCSHLHIEHNIDEKSLDIM